MPGTLIQFTGSPQDVTVREKLQYSFDLSNWLGQGETVASAVTRLTDKAGNTIAGAATFVALIGNIVTVKVDWTTQGIVPKGIYYVWVTATIGTRVEEGYAQFTAFTI